MPDQLQWQIEQLIQPPATFIIAVKRHAPGLDGRYAAQLLWQRGIRDTEKLAGYLNPNSYQPASPFEFGQEMHFCVERLQQARQAGEVVAIWGDFDADGITSTSVLWEGLGQFFTKNQQLRYYIPNRLTESHGLNNSGIDQLAKAGTTLIITCDTGSTNISEIEYAQQLGIDVIVTDHHTLPPERPPVVAIINPRYLPTNHPLFNLSGVAVAYKVVEALYETLPDVPQQPVENLLDLVAIGLIADLVQLSGDCRYLAQKGIERLQQQTKQPTRPGVAKLLELCQRSGDRPTDISFGLGPRINAVSRIQGDASFCVELLTSKNKQRCEQLALETELANARRKSLQKDVTQQVKDKLSQLDLSTTSVIVLVDSQWSSGVLGLVAGQVAQEYGRPTIILSTESDNNFSEKVEQGSRGDLDNNHSPQPTPHVNTPHASNLTPDSSLLTPHPSPLTPLARGSARSVNNIDLYQLVRSQAHLLHRFGGHPFAAGLSIPIENIPLFTEAINQQLRQLSLASGALMMPVIQADLTVTVAELGKELFRELKLLEPCGMGNPVPKLLIKNCSFKNVWNRNTQDAKGKKIQYIKTDFEIVDLTTDKGFPGLWWGHYKDEVPTGRCDAIVELDYNNYKQRPEVRLIAVRPTVEDRQFSTNVQLDWILDWRNLSDEEKSINTQSTSALSHQSSALILEECPTRWDDLQVWLRRAIQTNNKLAIAYPQPEQLPANKIWEQLVGIAKYLSRTGKTVTLDQIQDKLGVSDRALQLGLRTLTQLGFQITTFDNHIQIIWSSDSYFHHTEDQLTSASEQFLAAVAEEQFYQRYFYVVPLTTIQSMARETVYR
ncbi:putative exonuclease, RecJ [Crinalium epipsammum PCC 9333]|uniref:Single-stranded-DNA-specific exonuclease RecJ n=1 Tax=Crinalium epipsammum PCC 9333 TaxID=1173022 RepID=K9VUL4_9CYAN|nr:DHH family phosphoesterase [Crinalium epipsammum]AFZ11162.1 putative exonuclease, RecJ [Crinalium epipsammum PCC 9333]